MTALVRRRITRWHILGGTAAVLTALILGAVVGGVIWVIVRGVGYILTHAWWAR